MGITLNQLTNSISKVVTKLREEFTHSNISVLDKLSTSNNGYLLYNDKQVAGSGVLLRDETVLWEGTLKTVGETVTLLDDIHNYDEFIVYTTQINNDRQHLMDIHSTSEIYDTYKDINNFGVGVANAQAWIYYSFVDEKTLRADEINNVCITKIVGIRYKQTQNTTVLWEGNQTTAGTLDLYDNYTNYEHLVLITGNGVWADGGATSIWYVNENKTHIVSIEQGNNHIWYCFNRLDDTKHINVKISSSATNGVGYWNPQDCPLIKIIGIRATLPTDGEVVTDAQVLSEIEATINLLNTEEGE